ncbi:hypothetical protein K4749_01340 [Streptomyces sp. TRM72054]|uniref:hypothetical protein n=1 Tax=Streptomyces sp. TRM72054 TaxID=2870562 RepID=UPI001C8CAF41|nr:hypothetical protein [Streptomyces sp. TRM72054]MBX9392275.1 hypothetical protein [Streptomyces sp. TRM72054]
MSFDKREVRVYESAARTASPTASGIDAAYARGVHVVIDVTAVAATPSVTPSIEGYDTLSGKWYTLLTGSAITAEGTTVLKIYPGIATIANAAASDVIPNRIRVSMTHADADSITYTVAAHLMA